MNETLQAIVDELEESIEKIEKTIPNNEAFNIAHANWSFPGLDRSQLVQKIQNLIDDINNSGLEELSVPDDEIEPLVNRLQYLNTNTIANIWSNPAAGVPALILTLDGVSEKLSPILKVDQAKIASGEIRRIRTQIRSLEALLSDLTPRGNQIEAFVSRIEKANEAAEQLPVDLQSLVEARAKISKIDAEISQTIGEIKGKKEQADKLETSLREQEEAARAVITQCEQAYAASTSVGLAAAFIERSKSLSFSMWVWVAGLTASLMAGGYFGSLRLQKLSESLSQVNVSQESLVFSAALSLLSIGAPIWFSWLATKQIGQRFRLSEDYAFKASVSRAYEGFRRETARYDEEMEIRLLASALARLDEEPLRLVETSSHGSPAHELLNSDTVKTAINSIPSMAIDIKNMAANAIANRRRKVVEEEDE